MSIVRKEFSFPAANGAHDIYACIWIESQISKYRGVVQIAHGMAEHVLRYEEFAVFLAGQGFLVCGNDHAGHGRSVIDKAELGYFGQENGDQFLIEDMLYLTKFIKGRFGSIPYFLLGHSMGSFLARQFVNSYNEELSGCILLGSSAGHPLLELAIKLSERGIEKKGIMDRGRAVYKLAFDAFNLKFMPRRTEFDWLSRDESEVDQFIADEKCGFVFTNGGFRDLFTVLLKINEDSFFESFPKKIPLLLLSGTHDPVGDYGKGIEKVANKFLDSGCEDISVKIYENARHELLHEENKYQVYRYILKWLNEKIG